MSSIANVEERLKLDHLFTLKIALDTKNPQIFEYVLDIGC